MNDKDFWDSIEATDEEKEKGSYYLRERGLEEHLNVLRYLESFKKTEDKRVTYCEIASVLRYDKRIRRCLFKYIGVAEERMRAHFLDYFRDNVTNLIKTAAFNDLYEKYTNDLYKTISHLYFGPLVCLLKKQQNDFKESLFGYLEKLKVNLDALVSLRNQVCHNKFLLNNLEFKKCFYKGSKSASLHANIRNLYLLLDDRCRDGLINEINSCARSGGSKYKNQVNWKLPDDVKVSFDKDSFI